MYLKKIVDWIAHTQNLVSTNDVNNYFESRDSFSNNSSHAETSVLDFCLIEPTNNDNNVISNSEERGNLNNETLHCKLFGNKEIPSNGSSFSISKTGDGTSLPEENKRDTIFKSSNIPDSARVIRPTSDTTNCRSIFTQTDDEFESRHHSSRKRYNHNDSRPVQPVKRNISLPIDISRSAFHVCQKSSEEKNESPVFGVLYVVGCNKTIPDHLAEKMSTKYILRRRHKANGIKEAFSNVQTHNEYISVSPAKHVISYPMSNNRSVIVAFKPDSLTDMFQIGRYEKYPVDFRVEDINPSDKARNGVSRFACRILVRRDGNHEARLYAAAFDSKGAIFLGEGGVACNYQGKLDGFTTNGVLVMKPGRNKPGIWREVSVSGNIYSIRSPNIDMTKRSRIMAETNVLEDGTLIDLCGVTLVWRTPEGLRKTPNEEFINRLQVTLDKSVPDCKLLCESRSLNSNTKWVPKKAYMYLSCGHVVGLNLSKRPENRGKGWSCPVCRAIGPLTELTMGGERGFCFDREFPSYAFKPCGHAASRKTIEFWSSVEIPNHRNVQTSICPFCATKLNSTAKYVKLTLPAF